jgi:MarR family transcriptional regulator, organic hydroperoxide resistance regulator
MDPVEELRYLVLAAQRDGNRSLAALLRPLGVTPAQAEVIGVLAAAGRPLTVSEVGELLVCEPGSPSRLVGSRDGRASALALTDAGKRLAKRIRAAEERFHAELGARLGSRRDTEAALRALRRLAGDGASASALERRNAILPR